MYTVEVEVALDTGRPICIRNSDIDVEWPIEVDDTVNPIAGAILMVDGFHRSNNNEETSGSVKDFISHRSITVLQNNPTDVETGLKPMEGNLTYSCIQSRREV